MTDYVKIIDRYSSAAGCSLDAYDIAALTTFNSEIVDLSQEIAARKKLLQKLDNVKESTVAKLETRTKLNESFAKDSEVDIEKTEEKSRILATYMDMMASNDFVFNQVMAQNEAYIKSFHNEIKPLVDRSRSISELAVQVEKLQNQCSGLKQKADKMMAPSH